MRIHKLLHKTLTIVTVASATILLNGCELAPDNAWSPQKFHSSAAVQLLKNTTADDNKSSKNAAVNTQETYQATAQKLQLQQRIITNPKANIAARFFYIPGAHTINDTITAYLRTTISPHSSSYKPQALPHGATTQQPGCIAGSTDWDAHTIVTDPRTAPPAAGGLAIVCDITELTPEHTKIQLRAVQVRSGTTSTDTHISIVFNSQTHTIVGGFSAAAAQEFWRAAIDILRREAGSLSLAPVTDAPASQLQTVQKALDDAEFHSDHITVRLPAGIAAPELAAVGITATTDPTTFAIPYQTAQRWMETAPHTAQESAKNNTISAKHNVPTVCDLLPCVALTYDDGPGGYTTQLLDSLAEAQVSTTFFVIGPLVQQYPDVIKRANAEGHEFGSHTLHHHDLTELPLAEAKHEVLAGKQIIEELTGKPVKHFRPPYGAINETIVKEVGLAAILWNVDTNDWRKPGKEALIKHAVETPRAGSIILFHDIHPDSVAVAPDVISGLKKRGFQFVTVSELLDNNLQGIIYDR